MWRTIYSSQSYLWYIVSCLTSIDKYFIHIQEDKKVQQYINQMNKNKGRTTTFDNYWKSCWKSWIRTKESSLICDYMAPTLCRNIHKWCATCKERCKLRTWHPLQSMVRYFVLLPANPTSKTLSCSDPLVVIVPKIV